jgi:hypothetical protein
MKRRTVLKGASLLPLSAFAANAFSFETNRGTFTSKELAALLPARIPANIIAFIRNILNYPFDKVGIREGDNAAIESLLKLSDAGLKPGVQYADCWFQNLLKNPPGLHRPGRDRVISTDLIPFSLYCGHFSLSFSCYELYKRTRDERARRLCLTVADAILHHAARDSDGLVAHDDESFLKWAIPDAAYFIIEPLMLASILDKKNSHVYVKQAVYQTHRYFDLFYDKQLGIVKTIRFADTGLGKTYWCRAIGWLTWAIGGILRYLDVNHPEFDTIKSYLIKLADGALKYQGPDGGLRAFVNEKKAPQEITGTAMCARIINEGIHKDWLSSEYEPYVPKAKQFIFSNIDAEGKTQKAYLKWAVPAERGELVLGDFFSRGTLGYSGFLLSSIYELLFNKS